MEIKIKADYGRRTADGEFGRIGVLMGGPSSERDVSLKSGKAVYQVLIQLGLEAVVIDITTDQKQENINLIKSQGINVAFLALHGRFGEDGQMQEILDNLHIPYTGSGAIASRLAMDKIASRNIFEKHGLRVPRYKGGSRLSFHKNWRIENSFTLPLVVKPARGGSSIGLSIVDREEDLDKSLDLAFNFDEKIIIEEYIKGREVTVGILEDEALAVIEVIPKKRFFDYEAKYHPGMTDYIVPASLDDETARKIQDTALLAHSLLGCFGCCRVDMILNKESIPFVLEVNTIPGLTETSLLPKAAKKSGIGFSQLCLKLIQLAYDKTQDKVTA